VLVVMSRNIVENGGVSITVDKENYGCIQTGTLLFLSLFEQKDLDKTFIMEI
jgi:hypothetical protein